MATILLLDDEPDSLTLTSVLLSVEGHRILRAFGPAEALALAAIQPADVIVIDLLKSDITIAPGVCRQFRMHPKTISVPIIFISHAAVMPAGFSEYCDVVLTEPVEFDDLLEHIDDLLAVRSRDIGIDASVAPTKRRFG